MDRESPGVSLVRSPGRPPPELWGLPSPALGKRTQPAPEQGGPTRFQKVSIRFLELLIEQAAGQPLHATSWACLQAHLQLFKTGIYPGATLLKEEWGYPSTQRGHNRLALHHKLLTISQFLKALALQLLISFISKDLPLCKVRITQN
jgi:hypothetical protein